MSPPLPRYVQSTPILYPFSVLERVVSNLSHQNQGIVLSTVRIIIKYLDYVSNSEIIRTMCRRVTPVLVTLMTGEHEF